MSMPVITKKQRENIEFKIFQAPDSGDIELFQLKAAELERPLHKNDPRLLEFLKTHYPNELYVNRFHVYSLLNDAHSATTGSKLPVIDDLVKTEISREYGLGNPQLERHARKFQEFLERRIVVENKQYGEFLVGLMNSFMMTAGICVHGEEAKHKFVKDGMEELVVIYELARKQVEKERP